MKTFMPIAWFQYYWFSYQDNFHLELTPSKKSSSELFIISNDRMIFAHQIAVGDRVELASDMLV